MLSKVYSCNPAIDGNVGNARPLYLFRIFSQDIVCNPNLRLNHRPLIQHIDIHGLRKVGTYKKLVGIVKRCINGRTIENSFPSAPQIQRSTQPFARTIQGLMFGWV